MTASPTASAMRGPWYAMTSRCNGSSGAMTRVRRSRTLTAPLLPGVGRVRANDVAHQSVPDDVGLVEVMEADSVDSRQDAFDLHQARVLSLRQIHLRLVAGDHHPRVHPQPRQHHLHL